jgi:hypothetical protein
VKAFIEAHLTCYVVEQNRDGQLRSLLALETGIARDRMISVLDYGGLPLTAEKVLEACHPERSAERAGQDLLVGDVSITADNSFRMTRV